MDYWDNSFHLLGSDSYDFHVLVDEKSWLNEFIDMKKNALLQAVISKDVTYSRFLFSEIPVVLLPYNKYVLLRI